MYLAAGWMGFYIMYLLLVLYQCLFLHVTFYIIHNVSLCVDYASQWHSQDGYWHDIDQTSWYPTTDQVGLLHIAGTL